MLKSIGNVSKFVRFRMSVSVPPNSQDEVTFIYNVFKHKMQYINQLENSNQTASDYKPIRQIYYRHSKGRNRLQKFDRFIDIIYDLGQTRNMGSNLEEVYEYKLNILMRTITSLKGILRYDNYQELFQATDEEDKREVSVFFKKPKNSSNDDVKYFKKLNTQLTRATRDKPYFDVKTNNTDIDYSKRIFNNFDFYKVFQVHTIGSFVGEEALNFNDKALVDDHIRDKLLYGFNGFAPIKKNET